MAVHAAHTHQQLPELLTQGQGHTDEARPHRRVHDPFAAADRGSSPLTDVVPIVNLLNTGELDPLVLWNLCALLYL